MVILSISSQAKNQLTHTPKTTYCLLTHQWIPSHHSSPSSLSPRRLLRPPLPLTPTAAQAAAASLLRGQSSATWRFIALITGKYFMYLVSCSFTYRFTYLPAASPPTCIHDFVLRMFPPSLSRAEVLIHTHLFRRLRPGNVAHSVN